MEISLVRNVVLGVAALGTTEWFALQNPVQASPSNSAPRKEHVRAGSTPMPDIIQYAQSPVEKYGRVDFGNGCGAIPPGLQITPDCSYKKTDIYFKDANGLENRSVEFNGRIVRVSNIGGVFVQNVGDPKDVWYRTNVAVYTTKEDRSRPELTIGRDIMISGDTVLAIIELPNIDGKKTFEVWVSHDGVEFMPAYYRNDPSFDRGKSS